ncbi:hypothetical protein LTSEINV_5419 [Salmonella enterica subsp. enterica serovar Inverness str. R8-3668]|uniref:Uncharacterized protein n=1 Tax=Salmonella enterica subsp. enterica serovar Inverness str. R8-3668 TaxID=913075 RepID=G5NJY7_SALET|nr:hypothetical protein LTSEINV_5419 [Salmonella enterica subsp. enterica serovar Inverness str. R8-3668]
MKVNRLKVMPMNIPSERTHQGNPRSATDYCHQLKNGNRPGD